MTSMLTLNSIARIGNGEVLCNPILQILEFTATSEYRHSVHRSDGNTTIQSLFSSPLSSLFTSSQVEIRSLVQINNFTCKYIQKNKYVFTCLLFPTTYFSTT